MSALISLHRYHRGRQVSIDAAGLRDILESQDLTVLDTGDWKGGTLLADGQESLTFEDRALPFRFDASDVTTPMGGRILDADVTAEEAGFLFDLCTATELLVELETEAPSFVAISGVHDRDDLPPEADGNAVTWASTPAEFRRALARLR